VGVAEQARGGVAEGEIAEVLLGLVRSHTDPVARRHFSQSPQPIGGTRMRT